VHHFEKYGYIRKSVTILFLFLSTVRDLGDGTYDFTFTATAVTANSSTFNFTVNGVTITRVTPTIW